MLDLEPATNTMADLIRGVADDQLHAPTPCLDMSLGDLIEHVDGLSLAFTAAASKTSLEGRTGPSADMSRLVLTGARAYRSAWRPSPRHGAKTRHGKEAHLLEAAYEFLQASAAENPQGTPGLFDAPVPVADDAPLVDRVIGLTGRDPGGPAA